MTELNVELAGAEIFLAVATMVVMVAGLFADEEKNTAESPIVFACYCSHCRVGDQRLCCSRLCLRIRS